MQYPPEPSDRPQPLRLRGLLLDVSASSWLLPIESRDGWHQFRASASVTRPISGRTPLSGSASAVWQLSPIRTAFARESRAVTEIKVRYLRLLRGFAGHVLGIMASAVMSWASDAPGLPPPPNAAIRSPTVWSTSIGSRSGAS